MFWGLEYDTWVQVVIAVIALLALIRPEIVYLFRKFTNRIDIYPAENVEITFTDWGPAIGMEGAIRNRGSDQFIEKIELKLSRNRDNATYKFKWGIFRTKSLVLKNRETVEDNLKIDKANSILLRANDSINFDIQFHDVSTKERYVGRLIDLKTNFENYLNENKINLSATDYEQIDQTRKNFKSIKDNEQLSFKCLETINNQFYWEEGEYNLEISVITDNPSNIFKSFYKFSLDNNQIEYIALNKAGLVLNVLGSPFDPKFTNSKLEKISN